MINLKNKSAVILNPERSEWVSRSHVTSVESVVNDGAKTQCYSAKRDLYGDFAYAQPLKMTRKALSFLRLRGASGAQGISTSALCREAHKLRFIFHLIRRSLEKFFKKNFRDDSFCFGFAKVLALALIFTLIATAESKAEVISCVNGKYADGTDCEKCGDNCNWSFDSESGKLNVSGSGNMYNYSYSTEDETNAQYTTAPWKAYKEEIKSVKVEGLSTIGKYAFCLSGSQLKNVEMDNTVTDIGAGAFAWNFAMSTIKLSDSLKSIGGIAFRGSSGGFSPSIIVPDTLEKLELGSLGRDKNTIQNMQIICLGDEQSCTRVKNLFNEYKHYDVDDSRETLELAGNVVVANYEQCSGSYFWNGAGCVREPDVTKRKCCDSCKDMGGWCNRIRYTPAEAAAVLHNDNSNSVTITFKK